MNVVPLAADSLGVRSMATYVECGQTRVLIDPGASLGRSRFNLPPSDEEWEALKRANDRISAYAARAGVVFISHYHEDHFRYDRTIYLDRNVWAKDPKRMLGPRQAGRAGELWKALQGHCRLDSAEGRRLETPDAVLTASPPLGHGVEGTALGYVIALTVTDRREGARFVHASDVQGPLSSVATAYLIRERPTLLYLSGPPAYLESQIGAALIEQGVANLLRIIEATGCRVILDHHALRAQDYRERFARLWETGRVVTAAAFVGQADAPLEASRRQLWGRQRKAPAPLPMRARGLSGARSSAMMKSRGAQRRAKEGTTE
jgi:predicted metallo-beta-lactamase superfamily hydrolase